MLTLAPVLAALAVLSWPPRSCAIVACGAATDSVGDPASSLRRTRRRRAPGAGADAFDADVLALLGATAAGLRAGLPQSDALRWALWSIGGTAGGQPMLWGRRGRRPVSFAQVRESLLGATADGVALGPVWDAVARTSGAPQVHLVARAWQLCEDSGAPLADALDIAAGLVRDRLARARRTAVNTAGPRATMNLLTALPVAGPLLGLFLGVDAASLLGSSVVVTSMVAGAGLLLLGRWWARTIVASLARVAVVT